MTAWRNEKVLYQKDNKCQSKYGAVRTMCCRNHSHDSKKEAVRCNELSLLQQAGEIKELEFQKTYLLIPAIYEEMETKEIYLRGRHKGDHKKKRVCVEQSVNYKADFVYYDNQKCQTVIEDCKGMRTKEYILKRKLMKQMYCNQNVIFLET